MKKKTKEGPATAKATAKKTESGRKPSPLSVLHGESARQLDAVTDALGKAEAAIAAATGVPNRHVNAAKARFFHNVRSIMADRKPDPKARKRARLEQKLARVRAELAALSSDEA